MCKLQRIMATFDSFDYSNSWFFVFAGPGGDMQWCFSQVKGAIDDDVAEGMSSDTLTGMKQMGARRCPVHSFI